MLYYVTKARHNGEYYENQTKSGYKKEATARRVAIKATQTWDYVEYGKFDEYADFPEPHVITIFIDKEEQGGDKLWDSLTQANQQALEEVNLNLGDLQPEAKQVQLHSNKPQ